MKNKPSNSLIFAIVCAGVLGSLFVASRPATANPEPPRSPSGKQDISRGRSGYAVSPDAVAASPARSAAINDQYGYILTTKTPNWIDATSGTVVPFFDPDDDYVKVDIGFAFPFYENTYTSLYISTNGLLTFVEGSDSYENRTIPRDTRPNNIIAPFWDDLKAPIGQTFYANGTDAQGKYFVVEWYQISRLETQSETEPDILTFEVVLYENGNILFQYNQLKAILDQATVGIEDEQGIDGSLYLVNAAGLSPSDAVHFQYPPASARAKIYPLNQGSLINGGKTDLKFTIRNTGDLGPDTYDLELLDNPNLPSASGWTVKLLNADGAPLVDSNGNGKIDTGPIAQDAETVVKVRITPPETAEIGDDIHVNLRAKSSKDNQKFADATIDAAVPTAFAQAIQLGIQMRLHLVWRENQISALASREQFSGAVLAVQRLVNGNYLYSWESSGQTGSGTGYKNLKYTILSDLGGKLLQEKTLTDLSQVTNRTEDSTLVSSVASDGRIGVMWFRKVYTNDYFLQNDNIFFTIMDQNGNIIMTENLTDNDLWYGGDNNIGLPAFSSPNISVAGNDHFILTWRKTVITSQSGDDRELIDDIEYMVYDANGGLVKDRTKLTNSQPGGIYYTSQAIIKMENQKALLSYAKNDPNLGTSELVYQILDSSGNKIGAETPIAGSDGATVHDSVRLGGSTAPILLAWPSSRNENLGYVLLDRETGTPIHPTNYLTSPNDRDPSNVSVARDIAGRGIITWADGNQSQFMYYALVSNDNGETLTPANIYMSLQGYGTISTNTYGYGLASYEGTWRSFMPTIAR